MSSGCRPRKRRGSERTLQDSITESEDAKARWAVSQLAANEAIEDAYAADVEEQGGSSAAGPSHTWAVFDGHGGVHAVNFVKKSLLSIVRKHLESHPADPAAALSAAFVEADQLYIEDVKKKVKEVVEQASASDSQLTSQIIEAIGVGSCGLVAHLQGDKLYLANAGDSRAVLGRRDPHDRHTYTCEVLTNDHNTRSRDEVAAVIKRSGDARAVVSMGNGAPATPEDVGKAEEGTLRVRGTLLVTRAFGDAYLKAGLQGVVPQSISDSLPVQSYITAEPEVRVVTVRPGDFLVMASDGLFEELSSEEVVRIAAECLPGAAPPGRSAGREREGEPGLRRQGPQAAATRLIERCIEAAAEGIGLSVSMIGQLPPGPARRMVHDDITSLVVFCTPFLPGVSEPDPSPRGYPMPLAPGDSLSGLMPAPTPLLGPPPARSPIPSPERDEIDRRPPGPGHPGGTSPRDRALLGPGGRTSPAARKRGRNDDGDNPGDGESDGLSGAARRKGAPKRRDV